MEQTRAESRLERRNLKQKLFFIRRFVEGEKIELNDELKSLKEQYEASPNFIGWSAFPERWDIGDPFGVKKDVWGNDVDKLNFERAIGKPYSEIILKETKDGTDY